MYCPDFELVLFAPIVTGVTFVFKFHMLWIYFLKVSIIYSLLASVLIKFTSPEITETISLYSPLHYHGLRCSVFYYYYHRFYAEYLYIYSWYKVPKEYNVAAILLLLFMVPISLVHVLTLMHFYISTFRSMCAVPNMAVFCSSLTSWFPGMVLTYFLNYFEIIIIIIICNHIYAVYLQVYNWDYVSRIYNVAAIL
jgi:hypothetical protein